MFDPEEQAAPTLQPAVFDKVHATLAEHGPVAAVDELCDSLRQAGDFNALFYALLMRKRVQLGITPFPTGSSAELPAETHEEYEEAIRDAGRQVGQLYLGQGDVRKAWFFFNMLNEPEPVREYIRNYQPGPDDDPQAVIEVAFYTGVDPTRGFGLILERYGICNAITTFSQQDFAKNPAAKQDCIKMLVRALHEQLLERLRSDIVVRGDTYPHTDSIIELLQGRAHLMEEDSYHIDTSHLSSVVQMSLELTDGPEVLLARELCAYGEKLGSQFRQQADSPFENTYADYKILLEITGGIYVEKGLNHFLGKIEGEAMLGNTFPAEVYVNLLIRLDRKPEAIEAAKKYLSAEARPMSCPGVYELCQEAKDYAGLAGAAKQRADGVNYLAGLIAGR